MEQSQDSQEGAAVAGGRDRGRRGHALKGAVGKRLSAFKTAYNNKFGRKRGAGSRREPMLSDEQV